MSDTPEISLLFATVVQWAVARGAERIDTLPGLWTGETDDWLVKLNGHSHEIEDTPPFGYLLQHKTALAGLAIGGAIFGHVIGPSEDDLIAHFRARTPQRHDA
jgi:hypothetical protein